MIKIAIIGAGNAGCFTALQLGDLAKDTGLELEISIIYDPNTPAEKVGQATFPHQPHLLWNVLNEEFNWHKNQIDATIKTGILYEGWGHKKEIFHPFPPKNVGMHFFPKKLQEIVVKSGQFNIIHQNVDNYSDVDADYIFDCRGRPKDNDDYSPLITPVNSCLLAKPKWDTSVLSYTRAVATYDGWSFVLPAKPDLPSSQGALGYLYNKDITTKKDAIQNLQDQFDAYITGHLEFKSYIANNPVIDKRVFLNGNRLYFLEPLEATACWIHTEWVIQCFDQIIRPQNKTELLTNWIHNKIHEIERFILWHYQNGSKFETKFWKHARNLRTKIDPKFNELTQTLEPLPLSVVKTFEQQGRLSEYGCWAPTSIKYWMDGVKK